MARKRKKPSIPQKPREDEASENDEDFNPESEDFLYDDIDKFHKARADKISLDQDDVDSDEDSDDEEEVMGLDGASSDEDIDVSDEDNEGFGDDSMDGSGSDDDEKGLPSSKAWGKSKRAFYSTDHIDEDMLGSDEEAELAAAEEEEEALSMQKRLIAQLDEDDFDAFSIGKLLPKGMKEVDLPKTEEQHIIKDLSSLSRDEKLELLVKDSPEIFEMLDEFKERLGEVVKVYHPLLVLIKQGAPVSSKGRLFIEAKHQALLNYCVNLNFYLVLKANKEFSRNHPVVARLVQYRELLKGLDEISSKFEAQMFSILQMDASGFEKASRSLNRQLLKKLIKKNKKKSAEDPKHAPGENVDPMDYYNQVKAAAEAKKAKKKDQSKVSDVENDDEDRLEDGKRAITNEMRKNKGLTRKRRKELQNPRVKHKMKFRKAIIRRKGQVRAVAKELTKYGGEATGIKANLTRSVRIK